METTTLAFSTGHLLADQVLQEIVTLFERLFPNRVIAYYVEGSYADQTAIATSDLDLTLVFRATFVDANEQEQVHVVIAACKQRCALELDFTLFAEQQLRQRADPIFMLGAQLVYGRDLRATLPILSIETWACKRMHAAFWLMINVFQRPQPVRAPLMLPHPNDPFYGYANRRLRLPDHTEIPTTRNLMRVTGWIATARIAYQAHEYVIRKRDCVATYRALINDEWTGLLEQLEQRCRIAWGYRIPEQTSEQAELCTILVYTLAFENHFLGLYRQFVCAELWSAEPVAQKIALELLGRTLYADQMILSAIHSLITADDPEIRRAAWALVPRLAEAIDVTRHYD
ncbi:hypothetical protein BH10CHL1_BH10CHL1_26300 [soil metagenome]